LGIDGPIFLTKLSRSGLSVFIGISALLTFYMGRFLEGPSATTFQQESLALLLVFSSNYLRSPHTRRCLWGGWGADKKEDAASGLLMRCLPRQKQCLPPPDINPNQLTVQLFRLIVIFYR
jgi:hypothetical protein